MSGGTDPKDGGQEETEELQCGMAEQGKISKFEIYMLWQSAFVTKTI